MSTPTFNEGQEISFGINDGSFHDTGFLDGTTVKVVEARYGKATPIDPKYLDPKKGAFPAKIVGKFIFSITKQDGNVTTLKPQEYSTGIDWDGENSKATVTNDGKRLVAKKGFTGFNKVTDFYHLLETAVNAGVPEDLFKGDISVFDGLTFQIASEPNPRARVAEGKEPKAKPFFALLIGGTNASQAAPTTSTGTASVAIDPAIMDASVQALGAIMSTTNGSISRRDLAAAVPPVADANKWDLNTRVAVMNTLFEQSKLSQVAIAAGYKLNGDVVTA